MPTADDPEFDTYRWHIPISVASPTSNSNFSITSPQFWIGRNETGVEVTGVKAEKKDWLIVNVQSTGKGIYSIIHNLYKKS